MVSAHWVDRSPYLLLGLGVIAAGCTLQGLLATRAAVARLSSRVAEIGPPDDPGPWAIGTYRQQAIVRAGLIEGPSFLAIIVYMLTGSWWAFGGALLGVAALVGRMPSAEGLEQSVEAARRR